jgi:hypothetical protein
MPSDGNSSTKKENKNILYTFQLCEISKFKPFLALFLNKIGNFLYWLINKS